MTCPRCVAMVKMCLGWSSFLMGMPCFVMVRHVDRSQHHAVVLFHATCLKWSCLSEKATPPLSDDPSLGLNDILLRNFPNSKYMLYFPSLKWWPLPQLMTSLLNDDISLKWRHLPDIMMTLLIWLPNELLLTVRWMRRSYISVSDLKKGQNMDDGANTNYEP